MTRDRMCFKAGKTVVAGLFRDRLVMNCVFVILALAAAFSAPGAADAARINPEIAGLCDRAAKKVALNNAVPLDVLRAISRTETGRATASGLQPWPWTVNMQGTGRWFATLDEARAYVFSHFKDGARSFDVGCFQINYKWHGDAFRSIDDMFDPLLNARYAAEFLTELYREFGNWPDAAGAYHSRTPKFADKYAARFNRIRAGLTGGSDTIPAYRGKDRGLFDTTTRDLRRAEGSGALSAGQVRLGSLVPIIRRAGAPVRPFVAIK